MFDPFFLRWAFFVPHACLPLHCLLQFVCILHFQRSLILFVISYTVSNPSHFSCFSHLCHKWSAGILAWFVDTVLEIQRGLLKRQRICNIPIDPTDMATSFRCWPNTQRGWRCTRTVWAAANRAKDLTPNRCALAVLIGSWSYGPHVFAWRTSAPETYRGYVRNLSHLAVGWWS